MNILFGSSHIKETGGYSGKIFIEGKNVDITSTLDAIHNGIGLVHQEFVLLGNLDISSNIKINRENIYPLSGKILGKKFGIVNKEKNKIDAKNALWKMGVSINPSIKVKDIPINMKQFVEIAREIDNTSLKILMLDEPTASLNQEDTKLLIKSLLDIAKKGISIIFVSHRLEEVTQICDRITVLRDGEVISTYEKEEFEINRIALDMVGIKVVEAKRKRTTISRDPIISFQNVEVTHDEKIYKKISLDIKRGEILGITGLAGYGQEIFGYGLMGLYDMKGNVFINGEKIIAGDIDMVFNQGIYMLPDERKEMGLLLEKPIWENLVLDLIINIRSF